MKGDFSRLTFNPKKRYSGVLMQQGRVQLDADWNEQVDITSHRIETETRDLIGNGGAPSENPGFEIKASSWLEFDGDNDYVYVEGRHGLSFKGRRPFTLEAWVSPHQSGSVGTIISKFNTHGTARLLKGEYFLDIEPDGSVSFHRVEIIEDEEIEEVIEEEPDVEIVEDISVKELALRSLRTVQKLPFDQFSHVAATFDGEESRIYLNGQLAAHQKHEWRGVHTRTPVLIGARMFDDEPALFYSGLMNDIRVWNVARTQEQIRHDMDRALGGREHGLVAYWRADEITDNILRDLSGHHHDGVLGRGDESQSPSSDSRGLWISQGRYYVDGILCENEDDLLYTEQPDYPDTVLPESGNYLAYLDVWQRFITAIEAPEIREVALGGPDTAGRSKVVSQVKLLPIRRDHDETPHRTWQEFSSRLTDKARLRARHQMSASFLGNQLYRVEVHSGGGVYGKPGSNGTRITKALPIKQEKTGERGVEVAEWIVDGIALQAGQWVEVFREMSAGEESAGYLMPVNRASHSERTITLGVQGIPPDFLNQHDLRLRPIATIKWSRENGSVAFPITSVEQSTVALNDLGQDEYALKAGDWVETLNDTYVLQGRSAPLLQVTNINRTPPSVTLLESPPDDVADNPATHPLMRRWDQQTINGDALIGGVIPVQSSYDQNPWLNLENGIQISFDGGLLQAGDYWLIPSRTNTGTIEWPGGAANPTAVPPPGIEHHYSLLALLRFHDGMVKAHDYRRIFAPLTEIESGDGKTPFVKKSGDTMFGSLTIERSLHVAEETHVKTLHSEKTHTGALHAGETHLETLHAGETHVKTLHAGETYVKELHGELSADSVGERQIIDRAVTRAKLADDVGDLWSFPSGYSILGSTPLPPLDFTYTESYVVVPHRHARWTIRAEAPIKGFNNLASAVVRDRIYTFTDSGTVWEFNPSNDIWKQRTLIPECGRTSGVAAVNDRIYVFFNSGEVWEYDPAVEPQEQAWTPKANMLTPRRNFGVAAVHGKIYVIGGERKILFGLLRIATKRNEMYDVAADSWERKRRMLNARYAFGIGVVNDKICLVGGMTGVLFGIFKRSAATNDKFNPATDKWSGGLPATSSPRSHVGVGVVDNKVYAVGGKHREHWTAINEVLEPLTGWSETTPLPGSVSSPNAVVINGKVYIIGGDPSRPDTCIVEEWPVSSIYYIHRKNYPVDNEQQTEI
jgi:hypothetical protein